MPKGGIEVHRGLLPTGSASGGLEVSTGPRWDDVDACGDCITFCNASVFEQRITLDVQHILVIHNGPSPTCASIASPPQHDCFRPGPERRAFSVAYLTPDGVWSLVWFQPPEP